MQMQTEYILLLVVMAALFYLFYTNIQSDLDEVKDSVASRKITPERRVYENRNYYYPPNRYHYYPSRYSYGDPYYYGPHRQ